MGAFGGCSSEGLGLLVDWGKMVVLIAWMVTLQGTLDSVVMIIVGWISLTFV